ncbi:MAG: aspartyl/asparaginyl beta-hydroxylase domain-containing protein [Candidatus Dormibacteraceae bacterium]
MKLRVPFLQFPLLFNAEALAAEIHGIDKSAWRPHPQGFPGNDALALISTGGDPNSDALSGSMRPTEHLQRCPYLMQVLDSVGATWGRTRLMRLSGQAEVTQHVDVNYYWRERVRVHVPIVTQPTVRFLCGDAQINMRAGECWIFDTWRMHNVINDHALARIHLVADTVGGAGFWENVTHGRPHDRDIPGWRPRRIEPDANKRPSLDFESVNAPTVMSPWEVREHIVFMLGEVIPHPQLPLVQQALWTFARRWHGLWSCHGEDFAGWPRYRSLIESTRQDLIANGIKELGLRNGVPLGQAIESCIFEPGLADRGVYVDAEYRRQQGTT